MKVPLFKIYWDSDDVKSVEACIKRGSSWTCGPEIDEFERNITKYIGIKYCTVFSSGTSALHALMLAYNIGKGDEVIVPSFTFIATSNAALFVGATPVFADVEENSFGLDPNDVEKKITEKTKAIIAVHYSGYPCKIEELREIADRHKILLIEDAAEAIGAKTSSKKNVGTVGDAAVLSFCQNKIITTGEGGAIITKDKNLNEKLRLIRSHGRQEGDYFSGANLDYISLGYNFRISSINAALGVSQIKKIEKIIKIRQDIVSYYKKELSKINGIEISDVKGRSVYQLFTIKVKNGKRDSLMKHLANNGISTKIYFEPVHMTHFYSKVLDTKSSLPVTESLSKEVLSLPIYPSLSRKEIDFIVGKISKFM